MNMPLSLQGVSLTRLLQGIAIGAVATMIGGFSWGGWMLGGTAKTLAASASKTAVIAAIAPICVDQFQRSAAAATNIEDLKKISTYQQAAYIEKGGWAMMPGSTKIESGVPAACAVLLGSLK